MILSSIVAMSENNAIGIHNSLPWHLPDDLKFFKRTTLGKAVLMGRKTYDSMGKPLPNRLNIVVSTDKNLQLPDEVLLYDDLDEALARLQQGDAEEAFIAGGGNIFGQTMDLVDRIYLTRVHTVIEGAEAFFPHMDHSHWKLTWKEEHPSDEKHKYAFTFEQWDRVTEI
ncbi:MAG TPA: dihydrofolate reductase [Flavipsychrobacter sp.]